MPLQSVVGSESGKKNPSWCLFTPPIHSHAAERAMRIYEADSRPPLIRRLPASGRGDKREGRTRVGMKQVVRHIFHIASIDLQNQKARWALFSLFLCQFVLWVFLCVLCSDEALESFYLSSWPEKLFLVLRGFIDEEGGGDRLAKPHMSDFQ